MTILNNQSGRGVLTFIIAVVFILGISALAQAQTAAVQYTTTSDFGTGFTADMKITNTGTQAISGGWTLSFDFASSITSISNAVITSRVGNRYSIANAAFNSTISAGGNVTVNIVGSPGNASPPTNYVFNGVAVGAATQSAFTYQGRFTDTSVPQPTNGTYNMQFALFGSLSGTDQIGTTITNSSVQVVNGLFTVNLNFTATNAFNGAARYLEISVFNQTANAYIKLDPRQQIMSSPYSIRTINANFSDALSTACVACVDDAKIASVAGSKVTGTVANASNATSAGTATTAGNVTGTIAIANGGTGSTTKNFVDLTTAQTVAGNKTFSNTVSATTLSAGSGGVIMNDNFLRLRGSADNNHGIRYNTTIDGTEFRSNVGYRWVNGTNGATERMSLDGSGNLTVSGTIRGTLATNSVSSAQITDGSLRLADTAIVNTTVGVSQIPVGGNNCVGYNINMSSNNVQVGDIFYAYFTDTTPGGLYTQPVIITNPESVAFWVCNSLNANRNLPAQALRIVVVRP